jgi:hypothetical protein
MRSFDNTYFSSKYTDEKGNVERMGAMRNAYKVYVENHEG